MQNEKIELKKVQIETLARAVTNLGELTMPIKFSSFCDSIFKDLSATLKSLHDELGILEQEDGTEAAKVGDSNTESSR